jgi:hypothetical protein
MTLVGLMLATGTFKPLRDCKERQDYMTLGPSKVHPFVNDAQYYPVYPVTST